MQRGLLAFGRRRALLLLFWWIVISARWASITAPRWLRALPAYCAATEFVHQRAHRVGVLAQPLQVGVGGGAALDHGHETHQLLVVTRLQVVSETAAQVQKAQAAHYQHG